MYEGGIGQREMRELSEGDSKSHRTKNKNSDENKDIKREIWRKGLFEHEVNYTPKI